jgi:hypothetical protein
MMGDAQTGWWIGSDALHETSTAESTTAWDVRHRFLITSSYTGCECPVPARRDAITQQR